MQTRVVVGLLWLGSLILAWFLGGSANSEVVPAPRSASSDSAGMESRKGVTAPERQAVTASVSAPTTPSPTDVPPAPEPLDFDTLDSAKPFMDQIVAIIEAHLRRGSRGHRALLQQLSELSRNEERVELLLAESEWESSKFTYRWLRLLVERDADVVSFVDALFRAAVETPEWFEDLDPNTLDYLTALVGYLLPGMASDEDLARMRRNLGRLLEQEPGSRPQAIEDQMGGLRALHEAWAGPLDVGEARRLLLDPSIEGDEKFEILRRSPVAAVADVDLAAILGPAFREQDEDEVMAQIGRFKLSDRDRRALDEVVLDWVATSDGARWMIGSYLLATGRKQWSAKQVWLEEAVRRGGAVRNAVIHGLGSVPGLDATFVERMLTISDLTEAERGVLRTVIKDDEEER